VEGNPERRLLSTSVFPRSFPKVSDVHDAELLEHVASKFFVNMIWLTDAD
jgi:hypothetical protein